MASVDQAIHQPAGTVRSADPRPASDPRHEAMVASLRTRYAAAVERQDAAAKQALFQEGVYLGILPQEFIDPA
ncbi:MULTISPECIES: hypothetical protein [Aphanothece]|uniref:hypothetical protein n=1 Tax=Aphanothece TaxID=1121 RepID=UPI00398F09B5